MRELRVHGSRFTVRISIIVTAVITGIIILNSEFFNLPFVHPLYPIYAVESSDSSQLIKQKISDLKKEIASKAAKIKQDISKHLQNKFILGQIKSSDEKVIHLEDGQEQTIIQVNEFTSFVRTDGTKKVDPTNLGTDNFALGLGEIDDKNNLLAKKVLISADSPQIDKRIVRGTVVSIEANLLTLRMKDESTVSAKLSKNTTIAFSKRSDLGVADLEPGSLIILVSTQTQDVDIARFIFLINRAKPTISPVSNSSPASNAATPSASVKAIQKN